MEDTEVVRNKYVPISIMTTEMHTTVGPLKSLSTQFHSLLHDMKVLVLRQNMSRLAMLSCCVLGLVFALSHHLFYRHLDATVVKTKNDQEWALRFGNAFALIVKTALIATISIAYTQHIWTVVRRKAVTVEGIDAIIAASNDFFAFLNREMWSKSLVGAVVAGLLWYVLQFAVENRLRIHLKTCFSCVTVYKLESSNTKQGRSCFCNNLTPSLAFGTLDTITCYNISASPGTGLQRQSIHRTFQHTSL